MDLKHANAAGMLGGNAVCGSRIGNVAADDNRVTCPQCIQAMVNQGYVPTDMQLGFYDDLMDAVR